MAHTNQTPHFDLPQFLGTDKASWIGDINPAMLAIDTALFKVETDSSDAASNASAAQQSAQAAETAAELAQTEAETATEGVASLKTRVDSITTEVGTLSAGQTSQGASISTLQSDVSALQTDVQNAEQLANAAQQTATSAQSTAVNAKNSADSITSQFSSSILGIGTGGDGTNLYKNYMAIAKTQGHNFGSCVVGVEAQRPRTQTNFKVISFSFCVTNLSGTTFIDVALSDIVVNGNYSVQSQIFLRTQSGTVSPLNVTFAPSDVTYQRFQFDSTVPANSTIWGTIKLTLQ